MQERLAQHGVGAVLVVWEHANIGLPLAAEGRARDGGASYSRARARSRLPGAGARRAGARAGLAPDPAPRPWPPHRGGSSQRLPASRPDPEFDLIFALHFRPSGEYLRLERLYQGFTHHTQGTLGPPRGLEECGRRLFTPRAVSRLPRASGELRRGGAARVRARPGRLQRGAGRALCLRLSLPRSLPDARGKSWPLWAHVFIVARFIRVVLVLVLAWTMVHSSQFSVRRQPVLGVGQAINIFNISRVVLTPVC